MTPGWSGNAVRWRGLASFQIPWDLWRYQELVVERRPDFVVETGSGEGGTTAFLRDVCRLEGHGEVIGVEGDSLGAASAVRARVHGARVMVILDSDVYNEAHMFSELGAYAPLVSQGQALVVCHTGRKDWGAGPALARYLALHQGNFEPDVEPQETLNPGGYWRRVQVGRNL